jgi:hypothetical protein
MTDINETIQRLRDDIEIRVEDPNVFSVLEVCTALETAQKRVENFCEQVGIKVDNDPIGCLIHHTASVMAANNYNKLRVAELEARCVGVEGLVKALEECKIYFKSYNVNGFYLMCDKAIKNFKEKTV